MSDFKGNKGEWSEVYIFLKLLKDGKLFIADKEMNALKDVFLNIVRIFREDYEYRIGEKVHICSKEIEICSVEISEIEKYQSEVLKLIQSRTAGSSIVADSDLSNFLDSMKISKLKSPAMKSDNFFGGTQDLSMEVMDYRCGINSVVGFSCKSSFSAEATLFNASKDNTNFIYEVTGEINDSLMNQFNNLFDSKGHTATGDRIRFLKDNFLNLEFVKMCNMNAERNLVLSGGKELPEIVAGMLKFYYYDCEGHSEKSSLSYSFEYAKINNIADYPYKDENLPTLYERKLGTLLYDMFTGMRFSSSWDGKSSVNGGYIIAKSDGDVVSYHSIIADEFKLFLIEQLAFERPSCTRHNYMKIEKINGRYFLKLNLQIRFKKIKQTPKGI